MGSRSNNGTRKKTKKNLNETKDMTKHLSGEQLAAVKIEGKRKETRSWITSKVCRQTLSVKLVSNLCQ